MLSMPKREYGRVGTKVWLGVLFGKIRTNLHSLGRLRYLISEEKDTDF